MVPDLDPIRPTQSVFQWIIANREDVLIGALVAAAIVGVMLVARLIGQRMVERESEAEHFGWQSVVGNVLARTGILFMVVAAVDIVANYAQPPARAQHLIDIAFTIAFAFQAAIWARELILADRPADSARARRKRRSAAPPRSSACWSARPCSRWRSSQSSTISASM